MKTKLSTVGLAVLLGLNTSHSAQAALVDAVEYYYSGHYFLTSFPDEIAAIDSGLIPGWTRSGYSFKVQNEPINGYNAVCRFYSTGVTRGSHFYTADNAECAWLKTEANWKYEANAFYAQAVGSNGSCPNGKVPVYRLYNNRLSGAPNHRYTTDVNIRGEMTSKGWSAEGVAFCAEGPVNDVPVDPVLQQRTAKMLGGTWTFSYSYNGSQNNDVLSFKTIVGSPSSTASPYYAQGTNQYGLPVTARYNPQTAQMEIRSSFIISATDYYSLPFISDNTLAGCYYFLPTNIFTSSGSCASATGTRN